MWKKIGVALIALIGTCSVVYAVNQELNATGGLGSGGNATGTISFKAGDRFYTDTINPDTKEYMKWIILGSKTYSNYGSESCTPSESQDCNNAPITSYYALAFEDIGSMKFGAKKEDFIMNKYATEAGSCVDYSKTKVAEEMIKFNSTIGVIDANLLAPRNVTFERELISKADAHQGGLWDTLAPAARIRCAVFNGNQEHGKKFFISSTEYSSDFYNKEYHTYKSVSWSTETYHVGNYIYTNLYFGEDGKEGGPEPNNTAIDVDTQYAVRPSAYYDTDKFVFGVSPTSGAGITNIQTSSFGESFTDIYTESQAYDIMKLRYKNEAAMGTPILHQIEKKDGTEITKATIDSTVYIKAEAKVGSSDEGVNTVSALIFDNNGNFKYYRPLEVAKGSGQYTFDLTGIPKGEYTISIVNEAFNNGLVTPASSSRIIGSASLKILDMLEIEYKADHETYTYDDNVHVEKDVIGKVSFKKGVVPISFEIKPTKGHENDYLNFDINPTTESDQSKEINVFIKADGPAVNPDTNSLKAGTYYFTIVGLDKNGDPIDDKGNPMATADVVLVVEKAQPKITFDAEDKGTREITGSKTEAFNFTEHATHTNNDIIHKKTGGNDYDILYTKESGKEGLINTLPQTSSSGGEISLSVTTNQTGSIVLKAFIAETENYKEAETTKTINVVLGLTAEYIEDKTNIKAGSDEAKPSKTAIGHIEVSGGKAPYRYKLIEGSNHNGSFKIDADGKVYVADGVGESGLAPGDYVIEVEVSDSAASAQKKTVRKTITVLSAELKGVAFENPDKAGEAVTEITRTYDPSQEGGTFHTKLFETIDKSLAGTTIVYSVENNEFLEYTGMTGSYANFKVKKATDSPIQIKAKVTGGIYGTEGVETSIPVKIEKYTQEIEFKQDNPYPLANTSECVTISATQKSEYWNASASHKITYVSSDDTIVKVNENGNICPVAGKTGTVTVTATLAEDDNYKKASAKITIKLIKGLSGDYIEDKKGIVAGSTEAKPSTTTKIGHFTATGGTNGYTYAKKDGTNDNDKFDIKSNGDVYVAQGAGMTGLLPGEHTIQVEVTDSTSPTALKETIEKKITIKPASLDVKFEDPNDSSKTIEGVITRTYDPSADPIGGSFHTRLVGATESTLTDTDIKYSVEADPNNVLEYVDMSGDYANFNVKKASNESELNQIKINAHVSGGYYGTEGADATILVNVEKYEQEIQFEQENPYPLENTSGCVAISATQKSDYWNVSAIHKITYESGDKNIVEIDGNGNICPVQGKTGTVTVTATLAGDDNYKDATATITINLLGELKLKYEESTPLKQAVNPDKTGDTGNAKEEAVFGPVSVSGGIEKEYNIQIKSGDYAFTYFELSTINDNQRAKNLKLKSGKSITAAILKEGITEGVIEQDSTNKDQYNWKIKMLPDTNSDPQEIIVHIIGADPILTFEKEIEGKLTTTYEKDGSIDLSVKRGDSVMDSGISVVGKIGYTTYIKDVSSFTTDAQLNGTGIVKSNCDDDDQVLTGKDFKLTPKAEASDGYKSGKGTPTPVIIKKANHPDVDFVDPDTILSSYMQSVDKGFTGILPDDKHLEITPQGESTWSGKPFIKDTEGDTTVPSVTITPNGFEGTITYVVNGGGTANYKSIENKEIHLAFAAEGGISYKPIKITYGDDTKKVIDYISDADKANNTYTYAPVEGNTYVNEEGEELFTLDGSTSTITTIQVGKTKVNVKRTDEKGNVITQAIPVEIVKKEITLTYESNTIYTGEALPTPAFKEPDAGVLVGSDTIADFPIPEEAVHYDGTEVLIDSETTGTYDTKGNWTNDELTTEVIPNYKVTIKAGKLTIKKDTVKDSWYHLEAPDGKTVSKTAWHNYLVDVVLDTATGTAGTYDQISNTKTFTDTNKTRFTVTNEDENKEDVYFRIDPDSEAEHKGAITSTQTTVKIDMTKPNVTKVTGYPVNTDGLSELIHNLTFGMFFKPGVEITIETEDPQPAGETGITVSGVNTVSYKVYKLGEKGEFDPTQTPKIDEGKVDANGKISFKINNVGNYRICAIAKDNATNPSNESCSDVNVKKVNVDIDGDGTNDFVDSDANGCPDLNIILGNDSKGNPVKLNVAEKDKKHPYMNIDSDGDGKADLNIDTDHDNKPDLNLVILKDSDWKPTICVVESKLKDYTEPVEYCTGTKVKAQINVDTDGDGVPNINIDTDGDFVADYNIDTDSDGKPDLNIGKKHTTWIPDQDYNRNDFFYDSIGYHKPLINIDTNGDGKPDINIDFDGDGSADINIDTNGDNIPDINIDGDGDGKPDYNLDTNEDGNPTKNVIILDEWKVDINGNYKDKEFGTMRIEGKTEISDSGIVMEKSDGQFLPNTAIKVQDISSQFDEQVRNEIDKMAGDQEIKKVYDVDYLEGNGSKQPDGIVIVKIPADPDIRHPKILVEKEDGSFEEVSVTEKDGYYVFETNYIGKVSVLGDVETGQEPNPQPDLKPAPDAGNNEHPSTSVKGTYTTQGSSSLGMGGAITGDSINPTLYVFSILTSIGILCFLLVVKKRKKI